jgi:hypothetical protein
VPAAVDHPGPGGGRRVADHDLPHVAALRDDRRAGEGPVGDSVEDPGVADDEEAHALVE